jgi:hypothetical protein
VLLVGLVREGLHHQDRPMSDEQEKWESIVDVRGGNGVRRLKIPEGWLYQIQTGVTYRGHPSWNNTDPVWGETTFVPNPPKTRAPARPSYLRKYK